MDNIKNMKENNSTVHGKLPPQSIDFEVAVLGALLIEKRAIDDIGDMITPDMFYRESHKNIFQAILDVYATSGSVDILTISQQLRTKNQLDASGGDFYLIELTQSVSSSAHIEYHSRIIIQKFIQRQLIEKSSDTIELSYNDDTDVFELLDSAYSSLNSISEKAIKTQEVALSDVLKQRVEHARKIFLKEVKAGIESPIVNFNVKTGSWRDGELIILAARPGMGKTAFVLSCALHSAKQNIPVAIFSLEMSKEKLTDRLISMEARIDSNKFTIDGLDDESFQRVLPFIDNLSKIPLTIEDNANLTIIQFQIKAKRLVNKFGVKFIIVDYLQLMSGDSNNREQEISKISRGLKITAKELNIPIIALSQLSRAVETRGSKRPMLSDLRESGAIEQDADMVIFLYRPEYYGIDQWDDDYDEAPTANECEYIVAKNRNGGLVRNRMRFEGRYTLFSNLVEDEFTSNFNNFLPEPKELPKMNPNDSFSIEDQSDDKDFPF